jgi:hypothetical protein
MAFAGRLHSDRGESERRTVEGHRYWVLGAKYRQWIGPCISIRQGLGGLTAAAPVRGRAADVSGPEEEQWQNFALAESVAACQLV